MIIKQTKRNALFSFKPTPNIPRSLEDLKFFAVREYGADFWDLTPQERTQRQKQCHDKQR